MGVILYPSPAEEGVFLFDRGVYFRGGGYLTTVGYNLIKKTTCMGGILFQQERVSQFYLVGGVLLGWGAS